MDNVIRLFINPLVNTFITSKIDWKSGNNLYILFGVLGLVQGFVLLVQYFIYRSIRRLDSKNRDIQIDESDGIMNMLNFAKQMKKGGSKSKIRFKSKREYDMEQFKSSILSMLMSLGFTFAMYYFKGNVTSLILQCVFGPYNLFKSNLFKAHILRQPIKRPFEGSEFSKMLKDQMKDMIPKQPVKKTTTSSSSAKSIAAARAKGIKIPPARSGGKKKGPVQSKSKKYRP